MSKVFTEGLLAKRRENAPDFVKLSLSFKCSEFIEWLRTHENKGWVNVTIKQSKDGKYYGELDQWEAKDSQQSTAKAPQAPAPQPIVQQKAPEPDILELFEDDMPF
jgi:hypothetical protein